MSLLKICLICLRTDIELKEISDNLSGFYEELCDYSTDNTASLSCPSCEYALKKCYNFKKHCRKAEKILRNWKKKKIEDKSPVEELHKKLPPLKFINNKKTTSKHKIDIEAVDIKNESPLHIVNEAKNEVNDIKIDKYQNYDLDHPNYNNEHGNNDNHDQNYNGDDQTHNNDHQIHDNDTVDNDHDGNNDHGRNNDHDDNIDHLYEDDDDKYLSEIFNTIKVEKEQSKDKNATRIKKEVALEETDEPKTKRKRARKPLTNQQEYETVFDIQLFHSEAEVVQEFEQRKHTERYITAPYKCTVCYTVYKCQKLLDFHMRWHDPSAGDFSCHVCQMRFKRYVSVRKHSNDVHYGLFKCRRCPLVTYHKMVMMHHFQKHQGVEFKCKHCNGVYRHSSTYMTHLRTRHRSEHVCVTCARTFVSHAGLRVHRKKMHKTTSTQDSGAGGATCAECGLTFATHAVYIVHVLSTAAHKALAATIIACPECGAEFQNKLEVRAHRRKQHPSYNYSAMKHAERNLLNGRKEDERVFDCTMCGKSGTHNTWLYRHYQAEHPHVPYEQVYNERRKHLCDECGRSFFTITALREHKHIHTGVMPYSCEKCPAKFRRKSSLKMHLERHMPPSRECTHCGKKFVSASNLTNHMRSHTGERRYKCTICGKGFLHSAAMKEHVRGVHHHIRRARKQHNVQ